MKYAFIDYENIHSLNNLNLNCYEKIFLFLGANLQSIQLSEKFNDELNITLITVQSSGKNNLDFHIAYYLGKMDVQTDKKIEFCVISKDNGYLGICEFIQNQRNARKCTLFKPQYQAEESQEIKLIEDKSAKTANIEQYLEEFQAYISKAKVEHLPRKKDKLCNSIRSQTGIKSLDDKLRQEAVAQVFDALYKQNIIILSGDEFQYPQFDGGMIYLKYEKYLLCRGAKRRPTSLKSLKNDIASKCNIKNDVTKVNAIIQHLVSNKIIKNSSELKIDYLK
jgi:hypothetical protein